IEVWREYVTARASLETLTKEAVALRQEHDFVKFQLEELSKAELQDGEMQTLEAEQKVQDHAEEIKSNLINALSILENAELPVRSALGSVRAQLSAIASFSTTYEELLARFESARIELEDIANEIQKQEERVEFDPLRAQETRDRLSTIYQLLKKHRVTTVGQLLALQQQLEERYRKSSNLDIELAQSQAAVLKLKTQVDECAAKLSAARQKNFAPLSKQLSALLKELGMPDGTVRIDHHPIEASSTGADSIELLFSANKGVAPRALAQVASGGEFSRFMFAIQYILAEKTSLPTLILDEIDTGVSGEIALQLGSMMKQMARQHQLIAITHLPQIAAKGEAHYYVYKDNSSAKTISHIRQLSQKERVDEIAKMISGANPSAKALENARELLQR
ncbi:MAG: DNA repair protein RecN, partial [Flammeovirgaceae bacterium]